MYMYNGHGDVTALLNQSGTVAVQYYYDAFGVLTEETARVNNPFRYSGYEYDEESGLYYLKSRHYDPAIARFMQEDTYRGSARDPLSLNLYTYCSNEPVMYYDPSGHAGTSVKVTMPDGSTKSATITNGVTTMSGGGAPPPGSIVHAANGKNYYVTSSGAGIEVNSKGTATVTITSPSGIPTTTSGTVINGVTYVKGDRPTAGSIVQIGSNMYIMEATKGAVGGVQGKAITSASQVTILNTPSKSGILGRSVNTTSGWTVTTKATADVSSKVVTYQYNGVAISNSSCVIGSTGFPINSPTPIQVGSGSSSDTSNTNQTNIHHAFNGTDDPREVIRLQPWLAELTSPKTGALYLDPFDKDQKQKADGSMGEGGETWKAIKQFQRDHGLSPNGFVDKSTWNAIQSAYYSTAMYTDQSIIMKNPLAAMKMSGAKGAYGYRVISNGSDKHHGIDFSVGGKTGIPTFSAITGTVIVSQSIGKRGNTIVIRSDKNHDLYVLYQHLESMDVRKGESIRLANKSELLETHPKAIFIFIMKL